MDSNTSWVGFPHQAAHSACQVVITYTAKVPLYNSLKACKSTMFFLCPSIRPFGQYKKWNIQMFCCLILSYTGIIWCTLVVQKLKVVNWLYKAINYALVDELAKKVIEWHNVGEVYWQWHSRLPGIHHHNCLSRKPDIEQYKLVSVRENASISMSGAFQFCSQLVHRWVSLLSGKTL